MPTAVIMSIFVNPLQFGPHEDLDRYPRDLPRDRALAAARGIDALFVPTVAVMYPPGSEIRVVPGATADRWEGAARPGHFEGVLTVVAKLFHLVEPDVACFGRKDIQQATLVRQMVRDLDWPLEIVVVPTAREPDGLALSSRNAYLDAEPPAAGGGAERRAPRRARSVPVGRAERGGAAGHRARACSRPSPRWRWSTSPSWSLRHSRRWRRSAPIRWSRWPPGSDGRG